MFQYQWGVREALTPSVPLPRAGHGASATSVPLPPEGTRSLTGEPPHLAVARTIRTLTATAELPGTPEKRSRRASARQSNCELRFPHREAAGDHRCGQLCDATKVRHDREASVKGRDITDRTIALEDNEERVVEVQDAARCANDGHDLVEKSTCVGSDRADAIGTMPRGDSFRHGVEVGAICLSLRGASSEDREGLCDDDVEQDGLMPPPLRWATRSRARVACTS